MVIQKQYDKLVLLQNLDRQGQRTMYFIIEEAKETVLDFSQRTVSVF